jgi:hypothetical protein
MANVHGLFSGRGNEDSSDDERENRFVGGISARGGGRYVSIVLVRLVSSTSDTADTVIWISVSFHFHLAVV